MEIRSYNNELAIANLMFKRPFSNIIISRNGKDKTVPCVIGNRSRIFKNLENPQKEGVYELPMIIITRTGITKNTERLTNLHNEVKYSISKSNKNYNLYAPVPIDITYTVSLCSKYPGDIDMMMSNFIPFFNKDLFVTCNHPKFDGLRLINQIIMDDNISEEHPEELDGTLDDLIVTTCNFTFKTYLFCGNDQVKVGEPTTQTAISTYVSVEIVPGEISTWTETEYNDPMDLSSIQSELSNLPAPVVDPTSNISTYISVDAETGISSTLHIDPKSPEVSSESEVTYEKQLSAEVSTEVSSVIDVVYDGFVPRIDHLHVEFHAVPISSSYETYYTQVDEGEIVEPSTDRFIWKMTDSGELNSTRI